MQTDYEASKTLLRLLPELDLSSLKAADKALFEKRLEAHFGELFSLLFPIYSHQYDWYFHLRQLLQNLATGLSERSSKLKKSDKQRLHHPDWFKQQHMLGMAVYVDLFAGNLSKLQAQIPYLKSLGVTYLHLMPLYDAPAGDSDGGYAVSDYRKVNPVLGNMQDLKTLASALEDNGISLVLDFVFNHTSDEHRWADAAKQGDREYQQFYYMFDDKTVPDQYEHNLREIFPQIRRGNFTFEPLSQKWVWTTFNNFQWDLNYSNPAVFNAITAEMLFLANIGADALRLDALAFIWKELGTDCENRPFAHALIRAFNCCLKIAAPGVLFKSEAIVHPDQVLKYIDKDECQLSYNPLLMALLWNSLATRKTRLLTASMQKSFAISDDCAWVNYVRCHDDIGWTFDDAVAGSLGINGYDHRHFLNQFYTGRFDGSFAQGVAFGENDVTGDCRVCGSLASLAGLEQAIENQDTALIQAAVKRVLLLHGIIFSIGGIPLLYAGDELGVLNDYSYRDDLAKVHDDRWVHRVALRQSDIDLSLQPGAPQQAIASGLKEMLAQRKAHTVFGHASTQILSSDNQHLFCFLREDQAGNKLWVIANFSEGSQSLASHMLGLAKGQVYKNLISKQNVEVTPRLQMAPLQLLWLYQPSA